MGNLVKKQIYIIHGWAYSVEPWHETVEALTSLGWDVRLLKVPGLTTPSEKVWDISEYVEWLHSELEHDEHPIVLGHSNGGRIALNYALAYPDHIARLILLNSAGIYDDRTSIRIKRSVYRIASKVLRPLKRVPLLRKVVYRLTGSGDYNQAPENMKKTLQNMLASDQSLEISDVHVPTTLIWGGEDAATPVWQGIAMQGAIENSIIDVHLGWGHAPYRTHAAELAEAIDKAGRS
jgi:pimeloyl-ACP methyl ester carboxylesterase